MSIIDDFLILAPEDVDLARSPLAGRIAAETHVLGAFNPGLTRLPNGNLLLMVRIAEALSAPIADGAIRSIRWTNDGYALDAWPVDQVDASDPRVFAIPAGRTRRLGLTSLSWLLPVEIAPDGARVVAMHYDKAIAPAASWQAYGIEDPRISVIGGRWYMTVCCVSPERLCTALYVSVNGLDYKPQGIIIDHQNKDMVLFEGKPGGAYLALTRPQGDVYFTFPPDSAWAAGPSIQFAGSPDALHWRPLEAEGIFPRKGGPTGLKIGGGTPPVLTPAGWLTLFHGVEDSAGIGEYRTFWALLDREAPTRVLRLEDRAPLLSANPALVPPGDARAYLPSPVVFSTGIFDAGDHLLVASGEADLA